MHTLLSWEQRKNTIPTYEPVSQQTQKRASILCRNICHKNPHFYNILKNTACITQIIVDEHVDPILETSHETVHIEVYYHHILLYKSPAYYSLGKLLIMESTLEKVINIIQYQSEDILYNNYINVR